MIQNLTIIVQNRSNYGHLIEFSVYFFVIQTVHDIHLAIEIWCKAILNIFIIKKGYLKIEK